MTRKLYHFTLILCLLNLILFNFKTTLLPLLASQEAIDILKPDFTLPPVEDEPIVIVLDPGHGPWVDRSMEPIAPGSSETKRMYGVGAAGNFTGTLEREINLNVALRLRDLLVEDGFTVIMTRTDHTTISSNIDRANLANENKADMMLRIHSDSTDNPSVEGASMLIPDKVGYVIPMVEISRQYGSLILDTLINEVGMHRHGLFTRDDQTGFNWSKVPIMTVELGFLSNEKEDRLLSTLDYQEKLAMALFHGIQACFNEAS